MSSRVLRVAACGVVAALGACHHASPAPRASLADHVGIYQFSEHVTAGGAAAEEIDIAGEVEVSEDTVTVDARPGPCRIDPNQTSAHPITYLCGTNVTLSFDRRDPVSKASYTAKLAQNESRQVCSRYQVDATSGRKYCAETQTLTTQRIVSRSGQLELTRSPGSDMRLIATPRI